MKRFSLMFFLIFVCFVWTGFGGDTVDSRLKMKEGSKKKHNLHTVLVKFRDGVSKKQRKDVIKSVNGKIKDKNDDGIDDRCKHIADGNLVIINLYDKDKKKDLATDALLKLKNNPHIEYAHYDNYVKIIATPDDARFTELWGLNNTGQTGGTVDSDIDAVEAWNISTGSSEVVIGVVDTGVFYTHPDLAANMWHNPNEIPNNNTDDDGNGYIDDIHGINVVADNGDPLDDHNHGTHCAGTIGAVGNDGFGVAGVCWNVKIMALKFLNRYGGGVSSDSIECINYVIDLKQKGVNIKVLSNSWGGGLFDQATHDAIYAAGVNGILFVAAAGNDTLDTDLYPHYPSSYDLDNIVSVAATDHSDQLAYFTNWGLTSVDLAAPGVDILSTVKNDGYASYGGTSMATPHVAGAAALMLSVNNELVVDELKSVLMDSGDPISAISGKSVSGKRLNVYNALTTMPQPSPIFRLAVPAPFSQRLNQGKTVSFSIDVESVLGFNGPVTFSASADPALNAQLDFAANTVSPGSAAVLNVTATTATALGNYAITVTGTSGSIVRTQVCQLEVIPENVEMTSYTNNTPVSIPDGEPTGTTSIIDVAESLNIWKITVSINITHYWIGDLVVKLRSPQGTEIFLHNRTGYDSNHIFETYYPQDFANEDSFGAWTLHLSDHQLPDPGTLNNWTLVVEGSPNGAFNHEPEVAVTSPAGSLVCTVGDVVNFSGSASDDEDGDLTSQLQWTSSIEGNIGTGANFSLSTLSIGAHNITASVTDSDGKTGEASVVVTVTETPILPPVITITGPSSGATYDLGDTVTFTGTAIDPADGDISGNIQWVSSIDGNIGTGASVSTTNLSVGTHTITATVVNAGNVSASATSTVQVDYPNGTIVLSYTNDTDVTIPDNTPAGVTSTINVPGNVTITELSVTLNILHTWKSDMIVKLISPQGTEYIIHNREGGSDDDIHETFTIPLFNGENGQGTWTLWAADVDLYRDGTIDNWTLNITGY